MFIVVVAAAAILAMLLFPRPRASAAP
jgi:hypothetical protein